MHLATAFSLMQKPANNFVESLSPFVRKELRRIIIAMVLATDNDRHFASLEKLEALVTSQRAALESERTGTNTTLPTPSSTLSLHTTLLPSTSFRDMAYHNSFSFAFFVSFLYTFYVSIIHDNIPKRNGCS